MFNNVRNHFSHMATHGGVVDVDGKPCQEFQIEIETQRDTSTKRPNETRKTMSLFIRMVYTEDQRLRLTHVRAYVFDPKKYHAPRWESRRVFEFDGDAMIEGVRALIAAENECGNLYKKIPELCRDNCDDEAWCAFNGITAETSQDVYDWFKAQL